MALAGRELLSAFYPDGPESVNAPNGAVWTERYGERHRQVRITVFPTGIRGPEKVRIYTRRDHYVLQVWDPHQKATHSARVDGDLVAAIAKAREIEARLFTTGRLAPKQRRGVSPAEAVERYLSDLRQRCEGGEVAIRTVVRYRSALGHFLAFCQQPHIAKRFSSLGLAGRPLRLELSAFLAQRAELTPAFTRQARDQTYILDCVRMLFAWASDPDRGALLPDTFRNPFLEGSAKPPIHRGDPLAGPDITLSMATDLVAACDRHQLRLFLPILVFGLRAAEPCSLFVEHLTTDWLRVCCIPELGILTKGRRDKRLPLLPCLGDYWSVLRANRVAGLLLQRRELSPADAPLRDCSLAELIEEYRGRCNRSKQKSAVDREGIRIRLLHDAGAMNYDHVQGEFDALRRRLRWPSSATLKDLRHLFTTTMINAGLPTTHTQLLLGHSTGRAAINAYTHWDRLPELFNRAVESEWSALLEVVAARTLEFRVAPDRKDSGPGSL